MRAGLFTWVVQFTNKTFGICAGASPTLCLRNRLNSTIAQPVYPPYTVSPLAPAAARRWPGHRSTHGALGIAVGCSASGYRPGGLIWAGGQAGGRASRVGGWGTGALPVAWCRSPGTAALRPVAGARLGRESRVR